MRMPAVMPNKMEREVTLFIAMSLDGYIADEDGKIDWLQAFEDQEGTTSSYDMFIKNIDSIIMGYKTYHQLITKITPNQWPYDDQNTFVITHRSLSDRPGISFVDRDPVSLVRELRQKKGKGIWICGGAQIVKPLVENQMIDVYHISIIPILLGQGIRLFQKQNSSFSLELIKTSTYNGITDLIYTTKQEESENDV